MGQNLGAFIGTGSNFALLSITVCWQAIKLSENLVLIEAHIVLASATHCLPVSLSHCLTVSLSHGQRRVACTVVDCGLHDPAATAIMDAYTLLLSSPG